MAYSWDGRGRCAHRGRRGGRLAREMGLIAMEPRGDLSSTGYALANPGEEYLVLQPDETADPFAVRLEANTYSIRWHSIVSREMKDAGTVEVEAGGNTTRSEERRVGREGR